MSRKVPDSESSLMFCLKKGNSQDHRQSVSPAQGGFLRTMAGILPFTSSVPQKERLSQKPQRDIWGIPSRLI